MIVFAGNLHGQLVPSELMAAVFPSGQQPKAVLSQEDLSSAVGRVVVATVVPGERRRSFLYRLKCHQTCLKAADLSVNISRIFKTPVGQN